MMTKTKIAGVIATAVVALVTAPFFSTAAFAVAKVPCYGAKACKCSTSKNSCKTHNGCKCDSAVMKTPAQCEKLGGTTEKPNS